MALSQKFKDAVLVAAVNVTAFYMGTRYPVLHCERVDTKYGESVRRTLREDSADNIIRVFLLCHYGANITDEDIAAINNHNTILPYLQGKECDIKSPYATN